MKCVPAPITVLLRVRDDVIVRHAMRARHAEEEGREEAAGQEDRGEEDAGRKPRRSA